MKRQVNYPQIPTGEGFVSRLRARLRRAGRWRSDREFLPAALEILETPPSPIKMSLLIAICLFFLVAIGWAYVGRIDIIAIAQGKLQPTGNVKVIEPLETSRVLEIDVQNGQTVHSGEILVKLDPSDVASDVIGLNADLSSYRAEALRRQAAITAVQTGERVATLDVVWPSMISIDIRQREERIYAADILTLNAQVESLQAQSEQKEAQARRLTTMISAQNDLIATLQQRVSMRSELVQMNAGSKSNLIDATETLQYQKTALAQQKGELDEAKANLEVFRKDIQRASDSFMADNAQKLSEAERQIGDLTQRLAKAQARLDHMTLRSPIDGTVQASTLTTVGQVVGSGQVMMRILPEGAALEIECYLPNKDIGFVKVGDRAIIKVESFPFTRYGTLDAQVTRVAHDAIPEPDAEQVERDPTRSMPGLSQFGAGRTQNLVFSVTLHPLKSTIDIDGVPILLGAGMAVTAEIRTGRRRILEYIFSPISQIGSEAMKER